MKTKQQLAITVETREKTIISLGKSGRIAFCESCRSDIRHLAASEAASALAVSEEAIDQMAKEDLIHSFKLSDGALFICCNSLDLANKITNK
jgi:hypothetical protein